MISFNINCITELWKETLLSQSVLSENGSGFLSSIKMDLLTHIQETEVCAREGENINNPGAPLERDTSKATEVKSDHENIIRGELR